MNGNVFLAQKVEIKVQILSVLSSPYCHTQGDTRPRLRLYMILAGQVEWPIKQLRKFLKT